MARPRTLGILARHPYGFFFNTLLFGAQSVARREHANLLVLQATPEEAAASGIARHQVDAWIVTSHAGDATHLLPQGKPVVSVGVKLAGLPCSAVVPDNRGGTAAAMRHLFEHGHERIGFVGWMALGDIQERYEGYQAALAERGIAFDAARVVFAHEASADAGRRAVRQLIDAGMPCSAIVVGSDMNALGVIEGLREAGYRIPGDVAVVGFDDIPLAQSTNPPLTTVRQSFDLLGARAAELLLADLERGAPYEPRVVATPVTLVARQSCGCAAMPSLGLPALADEQFREPGWQPRLARAIAATLAHPVAIDPGLDAAQAWPEIAMLVGALEQALAGRAELEPADIQALWRSDIALRANIEAQQAVVHLVERAAAARSGLPGGALATPAHALVDQLHLELMRSYRAYQEDRIRYLERIVQSTHRISLLLLDESNPEAQQLRWLAPTAIDWGCVGLWNGTPQHPGATLTIDQSYSREPAGRAPLGQRYASGDFPPLRQLQQQSPGDNTSTSLVLPLRTANRDWGFLVLAGTLVPLELRLSENATDSLVMWATHLSTMLERRELLASLRQSYENERVLVSTVRELGAPAIPLLDGVLLIPLVGAIDTARAQQVISVVLEGVSQHHADTVLLDLTAVPIVDTQVANTLIQAAQAATLLGSRVVLVGIRPEIAQSIVSLGIDLRQIFTRPTLAVALKSLIELRAADARR